ncbi:MAG: zinc-ribbon domain-containing protein [Pedobacter sp.]|nr:MAG: zinc-ribbon domain-containing protein [Pedobacter sp.]
MIIFGTRSKQLKGSDVRANCNHCASTQSVSLVFILKYFHIFWIPMFPLSKTGVSQCNHCKQVLYNNEMPDSLKVVYQQEKAKAKTPWGYRFGLILIALFFVFVVIAIVFGGPSKAFIKTPQVNDVYQIKDGERNYALYKVVKVNGDSIITVKNTEVARKKNQLGKLMVDAEDNYTMAENTFSKSELQKMAGDGKLLDIVRTTDR